MKLFTLYFGMSKRKMRPVMTDTEARCRAYQKARENSGAQAKASRGWHKIQPAEPDSVPWRQKSATIGGNRDDGGRSGYISKHGFQPHT